MLIPFGVFSAAGAGGGAAAGAYELISTTILSGSQYSVTFDTSSLGSTYKHLQIRGVIKQVQASSGEGLVRFNEITTNSYAWHMLQGYGSGVNSQAGTSQNSMIIGSVVGTDQASGIYSAAIIDILDFASTTKNKTLRSLSGVSTQAIRLSSGFYNSTNAITSITLAASSNTANNLGAGTRFSLYGIKG